MARTFHGRRHWVAGLLFFALSFFLLISLGTYHTADPPLTFSSPKGKPFMNLGGPVGAFFSSLLMIFLGSASWYLIPFITLCIGFKMFQQSRPKRLWLSFLAGLALIGIISSLSYLIYSMFNEPKTAGHTGGLTGYFVTPFLLNWFSRGGATVILVTSGIIALKFSLNLLPDILVWTLKEAFLGACDLLAPSLKSFIHVLSPIRLVSRLYKHLISIITWLFSSRFRFFKKMSDTPAVLVEKTNQPARLQEGNGLSSLYEGADISYEIPDRNRQLDFTQEDENPEAEYLGRRVAQGGNERKGTTMMRKEACPGNYQLPSLALLDDPPPTDIMASEEELRSNSRILENKLRDFGIEGRVVQALPGPVITMYEYEPAPGVKVSRIVSLSDDLALAMKAMTVRIVAPIPGKAVVGIEIPNAKRQPVFLKEILSSDEYRKSKAILCLGLGKDIFGRPTVTDLGRIPHLLIAGATGSGKSVAVNSMICSLLFNSTPEQVRLVMIDPKMLEFSDYDGIPHLLVPVVTNPKKAAAALRGLVEEMERRYQVMADVGVRNIGGYNQWVEEERVRLKKNFSDTGSRSTFLGAINPSSSNDMQAPEGDKSQEETVIQSMPYIVVIIDELADLMMVSSKDVEESITRLAQMARAAGIHLLVATQRPSVDVLTGLIKANFAARISFQVSSKTDSRTILDANGAEKLLGMGDMLFLPPGTSKLQRIHGAFVSETEIKKLVNFLKQQQTPQYNESIFSPGAEGKEEISEEDFDEKYDEAVALVARTRQASISMIQRRLRIGYNRSARIIEMMEREGLVGPADGSKPREVFVREDYQKKDWLE